jgi:AsmA protein
MNRFLRTGLIGAAIVVLLAGIAAAPLLISVEGFQRQIEARALHATGRALHINGGLHFTLLPQPSFAASDVTLANMPGGHAAQMVRVGTMRLDVKMIPLLEGRVEVTDIVLDQPEIVFEVSRDGTANWTVVREKTEESGIRLPKGASLSGITIHGGRVSYDNDKLGVHRTIEALNAHVALSTVDAPIDVDGGFDHQGQHFALRIHLATLKSLTAGRPTQAALHLDGDILHVSFDGTLERDGQASGAAALSTPSLKDLSAWAGRPISAGDGLGALSLKANVAAAGHRYALSQLDASLDGMRITGGLSADLGGRVPVLNGALAIDDLDLNRYLGQKPERPRGEHRPGPPHDQGWSRSPFSLAFLNLFSGKLQLDVGALELRKLKLGRSHLAVALDSGWMTAHLDPVRLYGGTGRATLAIDATPAVPTLGVKVVLANVAMRPLLEAAAGVDRLEATGGLMLDVTARGDSPDALVHSLTGRGSLALGFGRVLGIDLGNTGRAVASFLGGGRGGANVTQFDSFDASFAAHDGVLTTDDIRLAGPVVHATGAGRVDVGNQTIDLRLNPKVAIGGRADYADVVVPVTISGPWSHPKTVADMKGSAVTGLLGGAITGRIPLGSLLGGLFGGHHHQQQQPPPDEQY